MDYVERNKGLRESPHLPPLDYTEADLIENEYGPSQKIKRKAIINRINYINFQGGSVTVNFKHPKYDRIISRSASPQPCISPYLVCLWDRPEELVGVLQTYEFKEVVISSGISILPIDTRVRCVSKKGICLPLPETGIETNIRRVKRHVCDDMNVQLVQSGVAYKGHLVDFNALSFRVTLTTEPPQTFQWLNLKTKVNIVVSNGHGTVYSGDCRVIHQSANESKGDFILEPLTQVIQRYKPKEYRSRRYQLTPSPDLIFTHPFTRKKINLKVIDIAGTGFSVQDDQKNSVLLAGMVIPKLELNFAGSFKLSGKAQVVYRKKLGGDDEKETWMKCGLALLDMSPEDHRKLLGLIHQTANRNSYVCNPVNMDDLWHFFFETGFLYPKKYAFLQPQKEDIKATYEKLYTDNPNIARHFIYQERGFIRGHLSMVRFYENTWLIHHHAARSTSLLRAGLMVLDQVGQFTFESYRLHSSHMKYLMCYYRPDNVFPEHVFGGASRHIDIREGCSVNTFTYNHYRKPPSPAEDLAPPWSLSKTDPEDLLELEFFYQSRKGGLMITGLDLSPMSLERHELSDAYNTAGLKRERRLYSIKNNHQLRAIVMADYSDVALNMSDLTNCMKVFVTEPDDLPRKVLETVLDTLIDSYEQSKVPVLIYPQSYSEKESVPFEKLYNLWVLDMEYSDDYFQFIDQLNQLRKG